MRWTAWSSSAFVVALAIVTSVAAPVHADVRGVAASEATVRELTFVDTSRETPAGPGHPKLSSRTLRVEFHVPPGPGPFPVVLWSHGSRSPLGAYDELADDFVEPVYPLGSVEMVAGPGTSNDVVNQPRDASFVLSRIIALSNAGDGWIGGLVDAGRIGAGGESLGGFTSLGLIHSCCSDGRVKAVFAHAPCCLAGPPALAGEWNKSNPPLMLLHGDADTNVPLSTSQDFYARASAPKYFVLSKGGNHFQFTSANDAQRRAIRQTLVAFMDRYVKGDVAAARRLMTVGNTAGITVTRAMVPCDDPGLAWLRNRRARC